MLIICEGPDGSGKSNLVLGIARWLETRFPLDDIEVLHKGPPTDHPLNEYERPLFHYRPGTGHHIICDRWHIGEWVYPRVLGRSTYADHAIFTHIELFLASRGAVVVHTTPSPVTVARNVETRGDDLVTVAQTTEIISGYQDQVRRLRHLPVVRYDYTSPGELDFVNRIVETAQLHADRARKLNPHVTYVGPPSPSVLLLGDVRHELRDIAHKVPADTTIDAGPAFGPMPGTSGHFLLGHLPYSIYADVGVANACDVDDPEWLWGDLGYPQIVALGRRALDRARKFTESYKTQVAAVPHPQYVRRFHHRAGTEYGDMIYRVARGPRDATGWRPSPTTEPTDVAPGEAA